jgi:PPOX class probable F420-dependent enzyme
MFRDSYPAKKGRIAMIDLTSAFGQRVAQRLNDESVIWLTTVRQDGAPLPSPVWFLWDGETVLIYSQPNTPKLRNITRSSLVTLNFDGDGHGGNIIVLSGTAQIDTAAVPANQDAAYLAKYQAGIASIGMTPEHFAAGYSVAIRVTPTSVRGH